MRSRRWLRSAPVLAMLAAALWLTFASCAACASASSFLSLLPIAGVLYSLLRLAAVTSGPESRFGNLARRIDAVAAVPLAAAGVWMLSVTLNRPPVCTGCVVFWMGFYLSLALELRSEGAKRPRLLLAALVGVSVLGLAIVRLDKIANGHLEAFVLTHLGPVEPDTEWIRPGQGMHPDIVLPPRSALIIWTNCLPCRRLAAGESFRRFVAAYPDARVWAFRGSESALPNPFSETYLIPPDFFFQSLGIKDTDPPAYVVLDGHKVERVGRLADFR